MAAWNPNTKKPDLSATNGGMKITANTPITVDIMNAIVRMIMYIKYRRSQ